MIELVGKYNKAKVYNDNVESEAQSQIIELCNQEFVKDSKIRIMPDVHAGAGCTIGTTMTITNKIVPNLVGVDIGCGAYCIKLKDKEIDFAKLDEVIRKYVPSGENIRDKKHKFTGQLRLKDLRCLNHINYDRAINSLGSLGGGNHFEEINISKDGSLYLVIHSGSRYLGKQVATHYQNLAISRLSENKKEKDELIWKLKSEGRQKEIQDELKKIRPKVVNKQLAYVEGKDMEDYLHDMGIVQEYADLNRKAMADEIISRMEFTIDEEFTTTHNYIDLENMILRKGSISAQKGEKVLIPLNMRDGSIIAIGKGNPEWNYSAPHGAGRLMSRSKAKDNITLEEFKDSMKGIWTTSVKESTIDESPMAYKPMDEILENVQDTVDIIEVIKPIYNFKA